MMRAQGQEGRALEAAAEGPREECRQVLEKIRHRDLLPGHDPVQTGYMGYRLDRAHG